MKIENTRVASFQNATLPSQSRLAGLAALANALNVPAPVRIPACISDGHISRSIRTEERWRVYDKRYWPGETFADHLDFASLFALRMSICWFSNESSNPSTPR